MSVVIPKYVSIVGLYPNQVLRAEKVKKIVPTVVSLESNKNLDLCIKEIKFRNPASLGGADEKDMKLLWTARPVNTIGDEENPWVQIDSVDQELSNWPDNAGSDSEHPLVLSYVDYAVKGLIYKSFDTLSFYLD